MGVAVADGAGDGLPAVPDAEGVGVGLRSWLGDALAGTGSADADLVGAVVGVDCCRFAGVVPTAGCFSATEGGTGRTRR